MRTRILLLGACLVATAACSSSTGSDAPSNGNAITIGAFNFPESDVVAEIYAGALQRAGFPVRSLGEVGTRELVLPALQSGLVEVVPEYAGSAVSFLGGTPTANVEATHTSLRRLLEGRGIEALEPSPAESRNGLVVSVETAARLRLHTISDLIPYSSSMTLGGPPECPDRDLCLPGLRAAYGMAFASFLPLDSSGPLTAEAVLRGTVDVAVMFTTDGALSRSGLVLLEDDRELQPAENLTPLVRDELIDRDGPGVARTLDQVSSLLTTEDLRRLNALVTEGTDPVKAAQLWLDEHIRADDQA